MIYGRDLIISKFGRKAIQNIHHLRVMVHYITMLVQFVTDASRPQEVSDTALCDVKMDVINPFKSDKYCVQQKMWERNSEWVQVQKQVLER